MKKQEETEKLEERKNTKNGINLEDTEINGKTREERERNWKKHGETGKK